MTSRYRRFLRLPFPCPFFYALPVLPLLRLFLCSVAAAVRVVEANDVVFAEPAIFAGCASAAEARQFMISKDSPR
jgi:hypothetical protein